MGLEIVHSGLKEDGPGPAIHSARPMTNPPIAILVSRDVQPLVQGGGMLPESRGRAFVAWTPGFTGPVVGVRRLARDAAGLPESPDELVGWLLLTHGDDANSPREVPGVKPEHLWQLVSGEAPLTVLGAAAAGLVERHALRRQLEERSAYVQQTLDELPDGVAALDSQGRFVSWNRAVSVMTGLSAAEALGRTPEELALLTEEGAARAMEVLQRIRGGEPGTPLETELIHVLGHPTPVEITARVLREDADIRTQLIIRNITARREAEFALRESEERFRRLSEAAFEGILLHLNGEIIDANQQALRMFGYSSHEVIGRHLNEFLPEEGRLAVEAVREEPGERRFELTAHRRDGIPRLLSVVSRPFPWKGTTARVVTIRDISDERANEELLRLTRVILERTPSLVFRWANEPGSPILFASPGVADLGYDPVKLMRDRQAFVDLIHPDDLPRAAHLVEQELREGREHYQMEYRLRAADGTLRWFEDLTIIERTGESDPGDRMGILIDITARKEAEETIRHMAYFDTLTGLPNRVFLRERATNVIQRNIARQKRVAVMVLDVDRFKVINDSLGHQSGDQLLHAIGERLKTRLGEDALVTRLGGDEFGILIWDLGELPEVEDAARKVLEVFQDPFQLRAGETFATTSVGVSLHPDHGEGWDELSRCAELAMYAAKDEGRNTFQVYVRDMQRPGLDRLELENALRRAVERDELFLLYQPQVEMRTGRIVGVEALVRWNHSEHGVLGPMTFIPLAEETGLIHDIGRWVLRTGCQQLRAWHESGLTGLKLAVNLSARQFQGGGVVEDVRDVLRETGIPPDTLELELTESTVMADADRAVRLLQDLKGMGVLISIDDFGTGYSSLSHLKRFPIDTLKIDQTFVRDISDDPDDAAIASAVITLSHTMKLGVVAEGVENEVQRDFLLGRNCDMMQGFLFSRPLDAPALAEFIRSRAVHQAG
ncbi:MAG: EAL domain-containing protein [Deltaproteobacteria bacterium]|nr:MAG: EAL domain-containing protein [Deltaproteobacteria bacterium]